MSTSSASPDLLSAYASGALSEGMNLLVACHLTLCPKSRARVSALETLGGALLADGEAVPPAADCLERALARLDAGNEGPAAPPALESALPLPLPLRRRLGGDPSPIRWRFLLPGLSDCVIDGFEGEEVRLLRARPGTRILQHTHVGEEATLILSGRMRDGDRVYERGDVAIADETDDHHPHILGPETCLCLVVLSGPMRFTGPVGRALNFFT